MKQSLIPNQKEPIMTADISHVGAGMGTNRQRAGQTDESDATSESLEGKKGSATADVNFAEDT